MKNYDLLVKACKATKRDSSEIARLFTICTQLEGMRLKHIDFMNPNKAADLRYSSSKDHCSSGA
jgi:hypothetical protein